MRIKAVIFTSMAICADLGGAVEIEQGKLYDQGTRLESGPAGVALEVPQGYRAVWPAGTEFLVLATPDEQRLVFVYVAEMDRTVASGLMSEPIDLGSGIVLAPVASPIQEDDLIQARYRVSGTDRPLTSSVYTRIGAHGIGAAFITLTSPEDAPDVDAIAKRAARAVTFNAPEVPQQVTSGSGSWQEYLRGRYVVRYYTGSGYSEEEHIWLCSDGSFLRSSSAGGYGGGASGAFGGRGAGRWQASGATAQQGELVLQYGAGSVTETNTTFGDAVEVGPGGERLSYALALTDEGLFLDGTRWYRDANQRCP